MNFDGFLGHRWYMPLPPPVTSSASRPRPCRAIGWILLAGLLGCRTPLSEDEERLPPLQDQPTGDCVIDARGGVCTAGGCTLAVQPGILASPTPIVVQRSAVPASVASEVASDITCIVGPSSLSFSSPARLSIEVDTLATGFEPEDAVAVFVEGTTLSLAPDTQAQPGGGSVTLGVPGAATVAVSFLSAEIRARAAISASSTEVSDAVSLLRNLSTRGFSAAFHDGRRFYLGNGQRVLVYSEGIPSDPHRLPDLLVGAETLEAPRGSPSAASLGGEVRGIWSDGTRLVVSSNHRILIWNQIPTESFAPADLVLGQPNFTANQANRGRSTPAADTLSSPNQVWSDGEALLVADSGNHRVLLWHTFPRLVGQPADVVIGQADFDESQPGGGALPLFQSRGVTRAGGRLWLSSTFGSNCVLGLDDLPTLSNPAADLCVGVRPHRTRVSRREHSQLGALSAFGSGGLVARDFIGVRATLYRDAPSADDVLPDFVLGKPGFDVGGTEIGGISGASLSEREASSGIFGDAQRLVIPDGPRVLIYREPPDASGTPADMVIGQGSASTRQIDADYSELDADSLARPGALAVSPGGVVAIADTGNDRVLLVDGARTIVLGQPDAQSFGPNQGGEPTASTLAGPEAVLFLDGGLAVSDSGNHRVLIWNALPTLDGAAADVVLGQPDFRQGSPNQGTRLRDDSGFPRASADSLYFPRGLAVLDGALFVADAHNHRVLAFESPLLDGAPASQVWGQENFEDRTPNRGAGFLSPGRGFALPSGLSFDGRARLYVADTENNRVVRLEPRVADPTWEVLGQEDLESHRAPNFAPGAPGFELDEALRTAAANTLRRPGDVHVVDDTVWVADTGNHRVVGFALSDFGPGAGALKLIGQSSLDARSANAFGPGGRSLSGPSGIYARGETLYVADRENHRVLRFSTAEIDGAGGASPRAVLGQADLLENGFNRSLGDRGAAADTVGVARAGELVWVSDRGRHRVLGFDAEGALVRVLGQSSPLRILENAGGSPSASTLAGPTGLAADGGRLAVADTLNHRVLVWLTLPSSDGAPADLVLGQARFDRNLENQGRPLGAPAANTLRSPRGVRFDGDRLLVADSGNNRVLSFELSQGSGSSATDLLCQPDFQSSVPNGGATGASATGCFEPRDVVRFQGRLAVADAANDRVLLFPEAGSPGRAAEEALGQEDLQSRATRLPSARSLSFPVGLATDGVSLFVVDQGNHRVLSFYGPELGGKAARQVVGQPGFGTRVPSPTVSGLNGPSGVWAERLSFIETRLLVADTINARVLEVSGLRR